MKSNLGISELIERLKAELKDTQKIEDALFYISGVQLEISFTVEKTAHSGVNFHVLQTGGQVTSNEVQKIVLELTPLVSIDDIDITDQHKKAIKEKIIRTLDDED